METISLPKILMTPNEKFIESIKTADVILLREAISEGADVNLERYANDTTYFEEMIYEWGCSKSWYDETSNPDYKPAYSEDQLIEFARVLVENGLDVNHCVDDGNDSTDTFWYVAKWGHSLRLMEFLLQKGMNPNGIKRYGGLSPLDELESDIFAEECCGYPNYARAIYRSARLAVAYGALPSNLLYQEMSDEEKPWYDAAIKLDADYFKQFSKDELITRIKADKLMTEFGKYGYPHEFYYESISFQKRLVSALSIIIDVIGIENLDNSVLDSCVEQQFDIVLDYLLAAGANPNVNCFTPPYNHIKSSALYTVQKRGDYYEIGKAEKMTQSLISAGAVI